MEIQIPDIFISALCDNCGTSHAPIRDCPPEEEEYDREADYWKYSDRL